MLKKFKIINEEGNEVEVETICTFDVEKTSKSYVLCTDHSKNKDGAVKIYAFAYVLEKDDSYTLSPLTEEEGPFVDAALNHIAELEKKEKSSED